MKNKKGFTLIEILVVSTIIAILAAVGFVSYTNTAKSSRDSRREADLEQIRQALEIFRSENSQYPSGNGQVYSGSSTLNDLVTRGYISTLPSDPKSGQRYYYTRLTTTTYALCAYQENEPAQGTSCANCGTSITCNYQVTQP